MPTNDELARLIARVALSDRAAFDDVYGKTSAKLFGVLLRILGNRSEAEDALQDVFIKVWERADRFSASGASAMGWLIAVARNHAIDMIRARPGPSAPIDVAAEMASTAPGPEAAATAASEAARIAACMGRLDSYRAWAVRGAYLNGYSYQHIADTLDVPINTVRTWLRRSLAKLEECLSE